MSAIQRSESSCGRGTSRNFAHDEEEKQFGFSALPPSNTGRRKRHIDAKNCRSVQKRKKEAMSMEKQHQAKRRQEDLAANPICLDDDDDDDDDEVKEVPKNMDAVKPMDKFHHEEKQAGICGMSQPGGCIRHDEDGHAVEKKENEFGIASKDESLDDDSVSTADRDESRTSNGKFSLYSKAFLPLDGPAVPVEQVCLKTGKVLAHFSSMAEAAKSVDGDYREIGAVVFGWHGRKKYREFGWQRTNFQSKKHAPKLATRNLKKPPKAQPALLQKATRAPVDNNNSAGMEVADDDMPQTPKMQLCRPSAYCKRQKTSKKRDAGELDPDGNPKPGKVQMRDEEEETDQEINSHLASPPTMFTSVSLATASAMAAAAAICAACITLAANNRNVVCSDMLGSQISSFGFWH